MESAKFVSMYFLNFLGEGAVVVPRRNSGRSLVVMQPWRGSKGAELRCSGFRSTRPLKEGLDGRKYD